MPESIPRLFLRILQGIIGTCLSLYLASTIIFFFYFNYFATGDLHPFSEVNAAGKAIVWPYILFTHKSEKENDQAKASLPKTISALLHSNDILGQALNILHKADKEQPDEGKTRELMQQMKEKIDSSLDVSAIIDTNELNQILPGWGDHVKDEFIESQKLWQMSIRNQDKSQWEAGFDKMKLWNKWMESNEKAIRAILKEKYDYIPK